MGMPLFFSLPFAVVIDKISSFFFILTGRYGVHARRNLSRSCGKIFFCRIKHRICRARDFEGSRIFTRPQSRSSRSKKRQRNVNSGGKNQIKYVICRLPHKWRHRNHPIISWFWIMCGLHTSEVMSHGWFSILDAPRNDFGYPPWHPGTLPFHFQNRTHSDVIAITNALLLRLTCGVLQYVY